MNKDLIETQIRADERERCARALIKLTNRMYQECQGYTFVDEELDLYNEHASIAVQFAMGRAVDTIRALEDSDE